MKTIYSKRKFKISGFESGIGLLIDLYLNDVFNDSDDRELIYSLRDEIDLILDLKIDDYFETFCTRDNKSAANRIIIWRIQ